MKLILLNNEDGKFFIIRETDEQFERNESERVKVYIRATIGFCGKNSLEPFIKDVNSFVGKGVYAVFDLR